ncbi:MAG: stage V sporulation protein AD [Eubacteriales bacterium]|nr:stage V sporulation protein AD [Eubacteriales bacterium]
MQKGRASLWFDHPVYIAGMACVAGRKEGDGPLGPAIDVTEQDPMFGAECWEQAESAMQKQAAGLALEKSGISRSDVRYLFAGDLLGQLIATSFGTADLKIPLFGLYGACSTMGEAMGLGAMCVSAGYGDKVLALASSHYATAEKQFRFPLGYGNQRPESAAWTVTGCGAVVLSRDSAARPGKSAVRITGITTGRMVDMGVRDSMNMGAAMAPAAWDTIMQNFRDFGVDENYYDRIITGDLGKVGQKALLDFMRQQGHELAGRHMDCGLEIYDNERQDTHSGGSGCGCSAVTLCACILPGLLTGKWKRVLFLPTGALLSAVSFNEGQSIPGIAHGVMLESFQGGDAL